ncbi:MAG: MoaD/ThiS family protein [Dokdonella sp.]
MTILYFASLADHAGRREESVDAQSATASSIYDDARLRHGFPFGIDKLRVAVNGAFVGWDSTVNDGDEIVFIPPVSGG